METKLDCTLSTPGVPQDPGQGSRATADSGRYGDTPSTYLKHGRGALARQCAAQELREKLCHIRAVRQGPSRSAGSVVLSRRRSPSREVVPAARGPARACVTGCPAAARGRGRRGERACCRAAAASERKVRTAPSAHPASRASGAGAPRSALAFPAECHYYHSKGRAPPRGWREGQRRRRTGGRAPARAAGGQSAAAQAPAGRPWAPTLQRHRSAGAEALRSAGEREAKAKEGLLLRASGADPLPQFPPCWWRWKGAASSRCLTRASYCCRAPAAHRGSTTGLRQLHPPFWKGKGSWSLGELSLLFCINHCYWMGQTQVNPRKEKVAL